MLAPRPIRPAKARRPGVGLAHQPASTERVRLKKDRDEVARFVAALHAVPPADR
jgi:hypothetical protein